MVYETKNGYKVQVYDKGYVTLCELIDNKWQDCVFPTKEQAAQAEKRYYEVKRREI